MKTSLLIMAAGIGSRFGGGIKQLQAVGPNGEIIMDYSIHDAIAAGFNHIVFIIRKDIEADFRAVIGDRIEAVCAAHGVAVSYAYQDRNDIPAGYTVPADRTKPWGTGQAVLACRDLVDSPFAVINADDYYGKEAFVSVHDFLCDYTPDRDNILCMAGFVLKNTLSDNGGVTRGLCRVDESGQLCDVVETKNIVKTPDGAAADGVAIDPDTLVSMNMWGLTPAFMPLLARGFEAFFADLSDPLKGEYLLPIYIGQLLREKAVRVSVLKTTDKWFGVTYREDTEAVTAAFAQLIADGVYQHDLFADLV